MKFYIVDAFSDQIFGRNPVGVVRIEENSDFPSEEIQKRYLNLMLKRI